MSNHDAAVQTPTLAREADAGTRGQADGPRGARPGGPLWRGWS